ncbi:MAG: GIY-YIG nuclease family protein [Candidatus Bathyarchaeota archaeon]|nr:GIY-YIG nuclease family protein [Candidatus Bathyarchaeota archaeon]
MERLQVFKGIYALIIELDSDVCLNVGALGELKFKKGLYAYVGSAQANLLYRIKRHFRREKRLFWHIDYLLSNNAARIIKVLFKQTDKSGECALATFFSERGEPIPGFGCSDCRCKSHLFHITDYHMLDETMQTVHFET